MTSINIPVSDQVVDIFAVDTGATLDVPTCTFIKPVYQGSERLHCPAFVFLIRHASGRQILFDLGLRHDWTNLPPQKVEAINNFGWHITAGKPLARCLAEHGTDVAQGAVDAVIWSHPHLDHVGDMSGFPKKTVLVVGEELQNEHMPGYPLDPSSSVWNSDFEGRTLRQVDFEEGLSIGNFAAHDFFGDGSFLLLEAPVLELGRALANRGHTIEFATLEGQEHWVAKDAFNFVTKVHILGPSPTKEQLDGHYRRMQQWNIAKGIGQAMGSKYLWDSWWPKTYHGLKAIMNDSTTRPDMMTADFFAEGVIDIHVEYKLPIAIVSPNMPSFMMPCSYIPGQPGFQLEGTSTLEHASFWLRIRNELFFLPDLPAIFEMLKRTQKMRNENGVFRSPYKPVKPDYLVLVNSCFDLSHEIFRPPVLLVGLSCPRHPSLDNPCKAFFECHCKVLYIALGTHVIF